MFFRFRARFVEPKQLHETNNFIQRPLKIGPFKNPQKGEISSSPQHFSDGQVSGCSGWNTHPNLAENALGMELFSWYWRAMPELCGTNEARAGGGELGELEGWILLDRIFVSKKRVFFLGRGWNKTGKTIKVREQRTCFFVGCYEFYYMSLFQDISSIGRGVWVHRFGKGIPRWWHMSNDVVESEVAWDII